MTLKEVAELAGVSTAAVSRYFNGGPLGADKREKIRTVVEDNAFRPNAAARTIRTGKSGQIGMIVPSLHSDSISRIMSGVDEVIRDRNMVLILGRTKGRPDSELRYLSAMQENNVEGILFMGVTLTPALSDAIASCSVPVVVTGQNFPNTNCVYHDDYNAMKALTRQMIERGRRKILFLGVSEDDRAAGRSRRLGVEDACREAGGQIESLWIKTADFTYESGRIAMQEALSSRGGFEGDGVICVSDYTALGAIKALTDAGKRIPGDVSVAGIGDNWAGEISTPPLTSAHLYYEECGRQSADMLLSLIEMGEERANKPLTQLKLGYSITERGSI